MFSENYNVYLRALEEDDWQYSINWRKDETIWEMVMGQKYYVSECYERQWVKEHIENQNKNMVFVVCEKNTDKTIGYVYLNNIDHKNKKCGLVKLLGDRESWGKGYGTQMTMLVLHYAFYELGVQRVEASQLTTNKASIKVNEKCGFKNEGIARQAVFKNGRFVDINLMGCLKDDFDKLLENLYRDGGGYNYHIVFIPLAARFQKTEAAYV